MKIKTTGNNGTSLTKPKPAPAEAASAPRAAGLRVESVAHLVPSIADISNLSAVLAGDDIGASVLDIPPLCAATVIVGGRPKTGKSCLVAGIPNSIIFKLTDGQPVVSRVHRTAKLIIVDNLADLQKGVDVLADYARKNPDRETRAFRTVVIDPLTILHDWYRAACVDSYNGDILRRAEARKLPESEYLEDLVQNFSDIRPRPPYDRVADCLKTLVTDIRSMGFGVWSVIHYRAKADYGDPTVERRSSPKKMDWRSDMSPSSVAAIEQITDVPLRCDVVPNETTGVDTFVVEFTSDQATSIRPRVAVFGSLDLPNYNKISRATSFEVVNAAYTKAVKDFIARETGFYAQPELGSKSE